MTDDYAVRTLEQARDRILAELNGSDTIGTTHRVGGVYAYIHRLENEIDDLGNLAAELEDQLEQVEFAIGFLSQPEAFPERNVAQS